MLTITCSSFAQIKRANASERILVKPGEGKGGGEWTNNYPKTCFCCEGVYNLPSAVTINGPQTIDCVKPTVFSIENCKGTAIAWTVSPTIPFSGQGTNLITINPPYSVSAYTISVTLRCGEKSVSGTRTVNLNVPANITPAFLTTLTQLTNGGWNINTVPTMLAGVEHYWGVVYNGSYPNCTLPCTAIPLADIINGSTFGGKVINGVFTHLGMGTGITSGTSGSGYNYSGFPNNSCFKITHYVKVCGMTYRQTQCASLGSSNLKVANGASVKPNITIGEIEVVE